MTLGQLLTGRASALSAAEQAVWLAFYQRHGFAADRIVWATANAGAAVARTWGWKGKAGDLVPVFTSPKTSLEVIKAYFESIPSRKPRGG